MKKENSIMQYDNKIIMTYYNHHNTVYRIHTYEYINHIYK